MRDRGQAGDGGKARPGSRGRRLVLVAVVAGLALVAADLTRPVGAQATTRALLAGIDLYQATVSPLLSQAGGRCRFTPTCSLYGEAVIGRHGALSGGLRAAWRILRCGPWTPMGTADPPQSNAEPEARAGRAVGGDVLSRPRPVC